MTVARPTLPSLRSLSLLDIPATHTEKYYNDYSRQEPMSLDERMTSPPVSPPTLRHPKPLLPSQKLFLAGEMPYSVSPSSSTSSSSPTSPTTSRSNSGFRLVPSSMLEAHAILYVPPPSASNYQIMPSPTIPSISHLSRQMRGDHVRYPSAKSSRRSRALLLVGPAMKHLRDTKRVRSHISRGAKLYPYRIVPSASAMSPAISLRLRRRPIEMSTRLLPNIAAHH